MRWIAALLIVLASCSDPIPDFSPASLIDKLRILGVRAEPADIAPRQSTRLDALIADPLDGAREINSLWIICPPVSEGASSPCTQEQMVRDPTTLFSSPPDGIVVVPFQSSISYQAPANALDGLAEGSAARTRGVTVAILLVVFEGHDVEALKTGQVEMQVALKQIRIAPPEASLNQNPRVGNVTLEGAEWMPDSIGEATAGMAVRLAASATDGSVETFTRVLSDGTASEETETMAFSWYTTKGTYRSTLNANARTGNGESIRLDLPSRANEAVTLHLVLRDARGGIDWVTRELVTK